MATMKKTQMSVLMSLALLGSAVNSLGIAACMTNLVIYARGTASISVGTGTIQYPQVGGLDLISSGCYESQSNVGIWFHANCCPTNTVIVATVSWACNDEVKCGGGEGGVGTCGTGGSFDITLEAGQSEVYGFLKFGTMCCGVVWCQSDPSTCAGQGWPPCNYSNGNTSTNNIPDY